LGNPVDYNTFDMFMGYIPGSIAETSTLLILLGALLLIFTKVGSWRIMLSGFVGAALMALTFNLLPVHSGLTDFPWHQHLMVGGLAFGVVFMATDPVSSAQTRTGKWIYGLLIGILAIMIREVNPAYPEGV